jgi:hypothetical protein
MQVGMIDRQAIPTARLLGPVLSYASFSEERTRIKRGTSFYNGR